MALNIIWIAFVLIAFATALIRLVFEGDHSVFAAIIERTFTDARLGFELALGLTGVLTLWLGFMRVGEKGGAIQILATLVRPFFHRLFPEVPRDHPVHGSIVMNFAANMLGLDNAATPLGLKAMRQLQDLNPTPDTASNAQIMFLVLNTSGLTLIPISVMAIRATAGAASPTDVFVPILLTTFFSTLIGLLAVAVVQRIKLFDAIVIAYLAGTSLLIAGIIWFFTTVPRFLVDPLSSLFANFLLLSVITGFVGLAALRRVNVYEEFVEGAKEGFQVAIKIIPFLVAVLVAIGMVRESGALPALTEAIRTLVDRFEIDNRWVDAMPTAVMKPLSGAGARGTMVEAMNTYGADSFAGKLSGTIQGATDTTFYVIALYFGSVAVRRTRHAVACGLIADAAAIIAGICIAYLFFG